MWVFEEEVNGQKLTSLINQTHENVKYLPGITLPTNVVAEPDLATAVPLTGLSLCSDTLSLRSDPLTVRSDACTLCFNACTP